MIPDRLQYFLEHFCIDQRCDQIWTLGPRIYYQNTSTNTRTIWEHPWQVLFFQYVNLTSWKFRKVSVSSCSKLCVFGFELLEFEIWSFEIWQLKNWQFGIVNNWNSKFQKCEKINFRKMKCCKIALGNDEDPTNKCLKILDMNFISINKHEMDIW